MLAARHCSQQAARLLARGVASWSKFDPAAMSGTNPATVSNLGERGQVEAPPAAAGTAACCLLPAACSLQPACTDHPCSVPHRAVYGEWVPAEKHMVIPDPFNGEPFIQARAAAPPAPAPDALFQRRCIPLQW